MNLDLTSSPAVRAGADAIIKWLEGEIATRLAAAHQEIESLQRRVYECRAQADQRQKELENSLRASERHLSFVQANERKLILELNRAIGDANFIKSALGELGFSTTAAAAQCYPSSSLAGAVTDTNMVTDTARSLALVCDDEWRSLLKEIFPAGSEAVQDHVLPSGLEGLWTGAPVDAVAAVKAIKSCVQGCLDEKRALQREYDGLKELNALLGGSQTINNVSDGPDPPQYINPSQLLRNDKQGDE